MIEFSSIGHLKSNNFSDVTDASICRNNLGLGNYNNLLSTVETNSTTWSSANNSMYNSVWSTVSANSATWNNVSSVFSTVSANSSLWNNVYSAVSANSASWGTGTSGGGGGSWGSITGNLSAQTDLYNSLTGKVDKTTTINGYPLSGNITLSTSGVIEDLTSDYSATSANAGKMWMRRDLSIPTIKSVVKRAGTSYDANTKYLSHFEGTNSSQNIPIDWNGTSAEIINGNSGIQISNSLNKFGSTSLLANNATQYFSSNANMNIGTGDFTYEGFLYPDFNNGGLAIGWDTFYIVFQGNRVVTLFINGSNMGNLSSSGIYDNNTWWHVAIERYNGVIYVYQNGELLNSYSFDSSINLTGFFLQAYANFICYIDELRISNSARYTGAFDIPSTPFTFEGNTYSVETLLPQTSSSSTSASNVFTITKNSHGFTSATLTGYPPITTSGTLAQANSIEGVETLGVLVGIPSLSSLQIQQTGLLNWPSHGFSGAVFVSPYISGGWTMNPPAGSNVYVKPMLKVIDSNNVEIVDYPASLGSSTGNTGEWSLIERWIPAIATTSYTFSGLNGDRDRRYKVVFRCINGSAQSNASFNLRPNNATSTFNVFGWSGVGVSPSYFTFSNNGFYLGNPTSVGNMVFGEAIIDASTGYGRTCKSEYSLFDSNTMQLIRNIWTDTSTNITSLVCYNSQTDGFGVGTYIELWKLSN